MLINSDLCVRHLAWAVAEAAEARAVSDAFHSAASEHERRYLDAEREVARYAVATLVCLLTPSARPAS